MSDAILVTASELRNEPKAKIRVLFDDLIEFRHTQLKKPPQPYLIILTRTGDIPSSHPVFHPDDHPLQYTKAPIIIATTIQGAQHLPMAELAQVPNPPEIKVFDGPEGVDYAALFSYLYDQGIATLDCSAGGNVIKQFIQAKLIDEIRMTMAGQLAGGLNSNQELRPHFFPSLDKHVFTAQTAPHLEISDVRICAKQLLFLRMRVHYRH
jgi:riboflavin biosynthesis pyrimidine reductase